MRFHQYVSISFLFVSMCTLTRTPKKIIAANNSRKHVIIFDLTNVVIKENQIGFAKKIGYGTLANYTITHWKSPGYRCLDMLHEMSNHETQKPHITLTIQTRTMPRCLVELQEGKKTCAQVKDEITEGIKLLDAQKFFSSAKEKALMVNIMDLILDPESAASIIEPSKPTVQLIQKLKAAGHEVYLCGNAPEELYATAKIKLSHTIQHFNGIVISSEAKAVKPDIAIFNHLTSTYNLNPANCIVIEDLEESATAARTLGMQAIVFDKISHVTNKLKKYGVRI